MGTLVCLHAHPDDEAMSTGGTMARAAAEGHKVVLIVATGGEHGEAPADLADGETLAMRRAEETRRSADVLGIHAVEFLGYRDSGMTGWEQNAHEGAFMNAPLDEAAGRIADLLRTHGATVFTIYDWHGNYGHPDHIAVYRIGRRAAELAGIEHVYQATLNRDLVMQFASMADGDFDPTDTDDGVPLGLPADQLTTQVDVAAHLVAKRSSMRAHASQVTDTSMFLTMPDEQFAMAFGTEWYAYLGEEGPVREHWLRGL